MNKSRLRRAEAALSQIRKKKAPLLSNIIVYTDESDCERRLEEWRAQGGNGVVLLLPAMEPLDLVGD